MQESTKEYVYLALLIIGIGLTFVFPPILLAYLVIAGAMQRGRLGGSSTQPRDTDSKPICTQDTSPDWDTGVVTQPTRGQFMSAADKAAYLLSPEWKSLRAKRLLIAGHTCEAPGCTVDHSLECHHIDYSGLGGNEHLDDLVILCRMHHQAIHDAVGELTGSKYSRANQYPISILKDK